MCDELLLAIDTGGSKSDFLLLDPEKHYLSRSRGKGVGALNPGTLPVEQYLRDGMNELGAPTDRIKFVFCSLGGPNVDEVTSALKTLIPKAAILVKREADGDMILAAAAAYRAKAAVLCGTGSVAVGESGGVRSFSGGWGPYLGDGGSGGGIGYDALRLLLRAVDSGEGESVLPGIFPELPRRAETFAKRMSLKMAATRVSRAEMAAQLPRIAELAGHGDPNAVGLLNKAAAEVAFLAKTVTAETPEADADGVLALGGLFECGELFRELCRRELKKSRARYHFVFGALKIIDAAADFAVKIYNQQRVDIK
jgi:N-acetylglucosamine kinase-like BadF-type ATPase